MNDFIEKIKSKLVSAVDLDQKKIVRISDVYEALKTLESFPMTLDILNSSRIGKIVNDIRHFNEAATDVKTRLKDLIKQWNDKVLPQKNKKPQKPTKSSSNGCNKQIKVSESVNSFPNIERSVVYTEVSKTYRSSNNLEIMNGNTNKYRSDCDQSFEIPIKIAKYDNDIHRSKVSLTELSKSVQKENHFENAQISSAATAVDKTRKRKHESVSNGVQVTPLQKVKSTRELLAEMGDLVGNDTKKKILCNEIAFEDDIPRSCLPESVRPRSKPLKSMKLEPGLKPERSSPKFTNDADTSTPSSTDRAQTRTDIKHEHRPPQKHSVPKESPSLAPGARHKSHNKPAPIVAVVDEKVSLKLKIAVKHKKKSKHIEPPITNRMDELPVLADIENTGCELWLAELDGERARVALCEEVVERLAHQVWEGHNSTRHPIEGSLVPLCDTYVVKGLYILPWTDIVYHSKVYFPLADELGRISDSVTMGQWL